MFVVNLQWDDLSERFKNADLEWRMTVFGNPQGYPGKIFYELQGLTVGMLFFIKLERA